MYDTSRSSACGTAVYSLRPLDRVKNTGRGPRRVLARVENSRVDGTTRRTRQTNLSRTFNTIKDLLVAFPQLEDSRGGRNNVNRSLKDPDLSIHVPWHEDSDGTVIWEPSRTARSTSSRRSRKTATKDHSKDQYTVTIARTSKDVNEASYGNGVSTNSDNPEVTVTWAGLSRPHQKDCRLSEVSAALNLDTWDVDMALVGRSALVTRVPPWKFDKTASQSIASSC